MIPRGNVRSCVNYFPLINRTFRVRVRDTISPSFDQFEGVPQGSVLSALCFAVAINDIVTAAADEFSCSLSLDDFVLYLSGSTLESAIRRMMLAINRVADWTDSRGFRFSVENHTLSFSVAPEVCFRNRPLPSTVSLSVVREVRFLSMIFDERLPWIPHLRSLRLAIQSPLDLLRHLSHTTWAADRTTLLIYLVLVLSKLDYGAHVYCAASSRTLHFRSCPKQGPALGDWCISFFSCS